MCAQTRPTAYWWRDTPPFGEKRGIKNFGDWLTPLILRRIGGLSVDWAPPDRASIVCVGSILEHLPLRWPGTVAGAGRLHEGSRLDLRAANVLALRGPLSARGVCGDFALGDPGLLADGLVAIAARRYRLGVVPHWSDRQLASNPAFMVPGRLVIDPCADPLTVIGAIGACEAIVASSLHGIVVADAFGIPRQIESCDAFAREGGMFKFRDHCAAVGVRFAVGGRQLARTSAVEARRREIHDVLTSLRPR